MHLSQSLICLLCNITIKNIFILHLSNITHAIRETHEKRVYGWSVRAERHVIKESYIYCHYINCYEMSKGL